ncbi:MAG TPA: hypothetical protein VNB90_15470 [Cytophagaceae bacterium]|jgi:hypothetical protein|nr:hypothetical protein [Cytophagaceae bacterium]
MSFLNKHVWILLLSASCITLLLSGCYKKDLDDFKKVNTWTYQPEIAVPFLEKKITLNDTIPKVPGFTSVTMTDTASIELPTDQDSVESLFQEVEFKLRFENTFPFSGFAQIYFADDSGVYVDSLFDANQRIIDPGNPKLVKELTVEIDKTRYNRLTKNKNMYFYYNLTTNSVSNIDSDYLLINLGMKAKLSVNLNKK